MTATRLTNWARNIQYTATQVQRPSSLSELQALVTDSPRVRVLGTRHSFNTIADTDGVLVSVDALDMPTTLDPAAATVTVGGGVRYTELCQWLHRRGWAVHNLGSLPHISVAGAVATGTHGSGDRNGNLATAVSALEMITADGELVRLSRDTDGDRFNGAVVSLGALGVMVKLTLDVVPTYAMRQRVYTGLSWTALAQRLDDVFASGYSVSVFTDWADAEHTQIWVKRHADDTREDTTSLFGAAAADVAMHPIAGMPASFCTEQLGVPGPWHARLPHFRAEDTPSTGDELQSEYLVPREHAAQAVAALEAIRDRIAPVLQVCELRTVQADELWLSPSYRQDVLGLHFTWISDLTPVRGVMEAVEKALEPFAARPHWGKIFGIPAEAVRAMYPRLPDFADLAHEYDPEGKFRNQFVDQYLTPGGAG
ncbi:FAD-binding protein [Phytoactinopolyspora mesophila]|uniref:FAD-binding protein n=1 Tax=Phytoactinopolyspora mesophila TaxID=2650750 RepID=A0A7K3M2H7_9ACTN|nr:D-arabinono-1,4-lactone oxidase [Phytoactinopolyspora mesophila]NDL57122.1 FAD-binding protein [Phytoactinopolyspora mesophila]